jgi:hypothetical protein
VPDIDSDNEKRRMIASKVPRQLHLVTFKYWG